MTNRRWTDREIDGLFAGKIPADSDLARLAPLVDELRREAALPVEPAKVEGMARSLAEAARESRPGPALRRSRRETRAPVRWGRRLVTIGGVTALATIGIGGVAAAANGAAPGDLLYSVDRAFEAVGIGNGGTQERLQEAVRLADEGDVDGALLHAAHAERARGNASAAGTLETTASEVTGLAPEDNAEIRASVAEMLRWMESTDANGSDFGQGVAERARAIGDAASHGRGNPGDTTSTTPNDGSHGNSGDASHGNSDSKSHDKSPGESDSSPDPGASSSGSRGSVGR